MSGPFRFVNSLDREYSDEIYIRVLKFPVARYHEEFSEYNADGQPDQTEREIIEGIEEYLNTPINKAHYDKVSYDTAFHGVPYSEALKEGIEVYGDLLGGLVFIEEIVPIEGEKDAYELRLGS